MLGSRIVFAHTTSDWDRAAVARFFASHQLTGTAVTPAFVLMTIASLVTVMLGTALRARPTGGSDAGRRDGAGQVPQPAAADAGILADGAARKHARPYT